jgi:hypothetical protein
MKKKTIIILSILSSVLTLIYIIAAYFGIIRYFSVHLYSTESYEKPYLKLDKADNKYKVVISLTSSDKNINKLNPTVNSLLDQTVKVNEIAISVPYSRNIPKSILNVLMKYNYSFDYGKVGKVIPPLLREDEEDTIIIIVDENMIYGKDFIEEIISQSKKYPDNVIGTNTKNGILIKPAFFNESVTLYDMKSTPEQWIKKHSTKSCREFKYTENYKTWTLD